MRRAQIFPATLCLAAAQTTKTITIGISDTRNPAGTPHACYHRVTGGTYGSADRKDAGTAASLAWTLTNPALGSHFWACTSYYVDGGATIESAFSNEVTWTNTPVPPTITITSVAAVPFFKGATLLASSSAPATSYVEIGMGSSLGQAIQVDAAPVTDHRIVFEKLRPHTLYSYRWTVMGAGGQVATSAVRTFSTP